MSRSSPPRSRAAWPGLRFALAALVVGVVGPARAQTAEVRVSQVVPQGEVAEVRQVSVRFDAAAVAQGDPRAPAPFTLRCNGSAPAGDARWLNDRQWVFDLREPLAAGQRCALQLAAGFKPLQGALAGSTEFSFATGAPIVLGVQPYPGQPVEDEQQFLLRLNGAVDLASVEKSAWCEVEGLGERMPVRVLPAEAVASLMKALRRTPRPDQPQLLLQCQRPLPATSRVRLVWGPGIAAAGQPQLVSRQPQRFQWKVRPRLVAEFSCERENARAPCLPLRPMVLRFSAPVPRDAALAARLQPAGGAALVPRVDDSEAGPMVREVRFAAPLPENTAFRLSLPDTLKDETGRALHNAAAFPLAVATGPMPPLAKFPGGAFGIVEAGSAAEPALLPLTLRQVQADLAGARGSGQLRIKRLAPDSADEALVQWLARLRADHNDAWNTRAKPMLARESDAPAVTLPQRPAAAGSAAANAGDARSTEVIGVPLPQRGLHIVEVESRILGHALLEPKAPMHVRTAVLVTNLGVHFKRGRSSSLVWVTTLDRAAPVPGARVAVNDCRGKVLWSGNTDAQGLARIERGFDDSAEERCPDGEGLFVTARARLGDVDDLGFVYSRWSRGIENWRFNIATASVSGAPEEAGAMRAHTVFDRTLLRVGETVSMKHFMRRESPQGLAPLPADALPDEVVLTHLGSDTAFTVPLRWPNPRAAESRWLIPRSAPLGQYDVALRRGEKRWASGSLRIEAFRVPLVDARLAPPPGALIAPAELALTAQLNAMAGGPMPGQALQLSALLRPLSPQFKGYEDFSFEPPSQQRGQTPGEDDSGDGSRLVAERLPASTGRDGGARIVLPKLPVLTGPSELQAELSFADPNGETQTVSRRLRLWPAALVVGLRVPGWAAPRGEVGFTAVVLDTEGRPVAGRAVEVRGLRQQVLSIRQRIVGGFYAYDNRRQTQDLGVLCRGISDAQGRVACTATPQAGGEIELVASVRDDAGRSASAAASAWVMDGERWWFAQDQDDRIDLLPEKRELEPGQTARLQVRMPFAQATALVTVEREGVVDARVMTLTGRQPVIEVPIPRAQGDGAALKGSWAPNVVVSAFVLRGRLREAPWWSLFTWGWKEPGQWWRAFRHEHADWRAPTGMVDLAKPSFKLGAAQLQVGLADHRLEVKVATPAAQYKVRETVRATVSVLQGGKPAAGAQVAFAAVDEGLLALQDNSSWQLLEAMFQPRPWAVETATAQGEVIGRRHYGRKALPPGGGGGRNPTRELFDTLLLWRGTVQLDAQGQAVIEVPLNDSLTSFRLVAVADDGAMRFGTGSTSVRVTQDLQLLPGLAPLARSGDSFEAGFTLRNATARAMTVRATLAGKADAGAPLPALEAKTVQLAAGAATELRWSVAVPIGASRIDWEAEAVETSAPAGTAAVRDRVKLAQAIAPAVPVRVLQASLRPLEGALSLPQAVPADALPGSASVTVALQPRLSGALPGLRRWFEVYPFSCLEQKTSRTIALRDEPAWGRLRDELAGYLDGDGLAHYFPPQPGAAARGSDRLTAHLLAAAHEAGWAWPEPQREAMLQGLTAFVEGRIERRFNAPRADLDVRKLAALEALARHGRVQPRQLGSIAWTPAAWPTSALLDAWSLYRRAEALPERAARLDELQRLLRSRLVAGGTTLAFTTERDDDWWWLMDGADANAARLLLAASSEAGWKDDVAQLVTGLLARQRGGAWLTTTANLWGVLALERFAANFERTPVAGRSVLQIGQTSRVLDWAATPAGDRLSLPLSGAAALQARHEGTGKPWLTVQSLAAVPLQQPLFAGYRITKTVSAVQQRQPGRWSRGDIARVRIEVQAGADMAWVVVADPVPSGATVLGGGLGRDSAIATRGEQREGTAWPAYEERAPEAWRGYYEWMPRGRQVVEYTLRLNSAGRFGLPPTRVEAMYAPETFGELPNSAWVVLP